MIITHTTTQEVIVQHDGGYFKATKRAEDPWQLEIWTDKPFKAGWLMSLVEAATQMQQEMKDVAHAR